MNIYRYEYVACWLGHAMHNNFLVVRELGGWFVQCIMYPSHYTNGIYCVANYSATSTVFLNSPNTMFNYQLTGKRNGLLDVKWMGSKKILSLFWLPSSCHVIRICRQMDILRWLCERFIDTWELGTDTGVSFKGFFWGFLVDPVH